MVGSALSEPILIMATPRSGSSMTAGLFAHHGVWVGSYQEGNRLNERGYFEGHAVKKLIKSWHNAIVHKGILAKELPGFRDEVERAIRRDGYEDGPWLWKGSALYHPAFFEFKPKWVVVRRDKEATIASCLKSKLLNTPRVREVIDLHHSEMDRLVEQGAVEVKTDELVKGDYSSLEAALNHCGIEMKFDVVSEFIDPKLWHYAPS